MYSIGWWYFILDVIGDSRIEDRLSELNSESAYDKIVKGNVLRL